MASARKLINCFEWRTELPSRDCPRESPVFTVNGNECLFRFIITQDVFGWNYTLYLKIKSKHEQFKVFSGNIEVDLKNEGEVIKEEVQMTKPGSNLIWSIHSFRLSKLKLLHIKYGGQSKIQFRFFSDNLAESSSNISSELGKLLIKYMPIFRLLFPENCTHFNILHNEQ